MKEGKECQERAKVNWAADTRVGRGADKTAVCLSREKMCQTLAKRMTRFVYNEGENCATRRCNYSAPRSGELIVWAELDSGPDTVSEKFHKNEMTRTHTHTKKASAAALLISKPPDGFLTLMKPRDRIRNNTCTEKLTPQKCELGSWHANMPIPSSAFFFPSVFPLFPAQEFFYAGQKM